ncbi:uncharacterized protein si:cabz01007807.1 isoform X1 [Triplophysa rosa]|uniref:uncharacterized protein si:cabz01007807.1 isoform X1 n=1 Tax=Triplophysa rosa TaxID=992332 RepID=UPI002546143A|nr:uncharacterized protein si:cabz01007807.1 isoform X1 [Triplophysa rosa]
MDSDSFFDLSGADVSVGLPVESGHQSSANPFLPTAQNGPTISQWNPFYSTPQDYGVKMVDEENNIIQSKFLQNMKNLNIGQSDSFNQTKTESPPYFDLNLDNTLFPAPDWVVPPPPDFCQDTDSQTFNNHTLNVRQTPQPFEIWDKEAAICQLLNENVGTDLHSTPANQNTESESPSLSNQSDNLTDFIFSRQAEARTFPTLQYNSTKVFQKNMNTARFFETSTTDNLFHSLPTTSPHVSKTKETNNDLFNTFPSITEKETSSSTPLVPPLMQSNINGFNYLSDGPASTQNDVKFKHQRSSYDMPHTSPGGTMHDISQMGAQNGIRDIFPVAAPSASSSPIGNLNYRRRPPVPSPRSKAPKNAFSNDITSLLQTPSPPTLISRGTASVQNMTSTAELNLPVYEDILLTGQEYCVEDWPEDSPERFSERKPTGKLKLRRDSIRVPEINGIDGTADTKKQKKKVKVKFVPKKGFVIGFEKENNNAELKGACGYTVHSDFMKAASEEKEFHKGADPFTSIDSNEKHQEMQDCRPKKSTKFKVLRSQSQSKRTEDAELKLQPNSDASKIKKTPIPIVPELTLKNSKENKPQKFKQMGKHLKRSTNKEIKDLPEDLDLPTSKDYFLSDTAKENKPQKSKQMGKHLKGSKNKETKDFPEDLDLPRTTSEDYFLSDAAKDIKPKKSKQMGKHLKWSKNKETKDFPEDLDLPCTTSEDYFPSDAAKDNKPKKSKQMGKHLKKSKNKETKDFPEDLDLPCVTSEDYFPSDAAKAEWMSSQMDIRRARGQEAKESLEKVEEDEDTDSLTEWWNTVEFWDELPPDEKISLKEDENISFKVIADKVHRGLRVYLKLFMERAELLYQHVLILYAIADDLSNFHHRAKIVNITGGTASAVGGAAAITGLALAPVTFGASLLISAIGLGVATAGGITAASATISDNFNNMHDRKNIEIIVQDYETQLIEMQHCLQFITEGLRRLHSHPLLRRNNYYLGEWEVRRALQTITFVTGPVERAEEIMNHTLARLNSLHKGMDRYFTKDSKDVKKGCKKEVTAEVRTLAKYLHEALVELNSIREKLLDAIGNL